MNETFYATCATAALVLCFGTVITLRSSDLDDRASQFLIGLFHLITLASIVGVALTFVTAMGSLRHKEPQNGLVDFLMVLTMALLMGVNLARVLTPFALDLWVLIRRGRLASLHRKVQRRQRRLDALEIYASELEDRVKEAYLEGRIKTMPKRPTEPTRLLAERR